MSGIFSPLGLSLSTSSVKSLYDQAQQAAQQAQQTVSQVQQTVKSVQSRPPEPRPPSPIVQSKPSFLSQYAIPLGITAAVAGIGLFVWLKGKH